MMTVLYIAAAMTSCAGPIDPGPQNCISIPPRGAVALRVDYDWEICVTNRSDHIGYAEVRMTDDHEVEVLMGDGVTACREPEVG